MTIDVDAHIEDFFTALRAAWDAGNATSYSSLFTENASYVIFLGDALVGRADIERTHVDVFGRWQRGTKMQVEPIACQRLNEDQAIVLTVGGIGKKLPIVPDKFQTFVLVRSDSQWLCAAFHNTEMSSRSKGAQKRK